MFEQYDGYDYEPYLEESQDFQPAGDRPLETATRYGSFFCLGVFVTLLVRLFGELQPLFWILAIAGLVALAFAIQATRRLELIAIAAIVGAALLAGHWDQLVHGAQTAVEAVGQ